MIQQISGKSFDDKQPLSTAMIRNLVHYDEDVVIHPKREDILFVNDRRYRRYSIIVPEESTDETIIVPEESTDEM